MLGIRISEEEYAPEKQIPETLIAIAIVRTFIIITPEMRAVLLCFTDG
jgi:hypothetical protein